jgi:hypothetical protein
LSRSTERQYILSNMQITSTIALFLLLCWIFPPTNACSTVKKIACVSAMVGCGTICLCDIPACECCVGCLACVSATTADCCECLFPSWSGCNDQLNQTIGEADASENEMCGIDEIDDGESAKPNVPEPKLVDASNQQNSILTISTKLDNDIVEDCLLFECDGEYHIMCCQDESVPICRCRQNKPPLCECFIKSKRDIVYSYLNTTRSDACASIICTNGNGAICCPFGQTAYCNCMQDGTAFCGC